MSRFRPSYVRFRVVPVVLTLLTIAAMGSTASLIVAKFHETKLHAYVEIAEVFQAHFLEPYARAYVDGRDSFKPPLEALEAALTRSLDMQPEIAVVIWLPEGSLLYASADQSQFAEHDNTKLKQALRGERVVRIETAAEGANGGPISHPFIEIYFPIFDRDESDPIAIGELYLDARTLVEDGRAFERTVWLTTGAAMLAVIGMLAFNARQSEVLRARLDAEKELVSQNEAMRRMAEQARFDAAEANEQTLNYIGAEIHDGPLQLLGLASLLGKENTATEVPTVMSASGLVRQAMAELRRISSGLILPEIEALDTLQAIKLAISRHQSLTGATVDLSMDPSKPLPDLDLPRRICLYRVVQEGLTNAIRHGDESAVVIALSSDNGLLVATIESRRAAGPGTTQDNQPQKLGLQGMRRRIAAFDGTVDLELRGDRAILILTLPSSKV